MPTESEVSDALFDELVGAFTPPSPEAIIQDFSDAVAAALTQYLGGGGGGGVSQEDFDDLEARVGVNETDIAALESLTSGHTSSIATNASGITTLGSTVSAHTITLADHEDRIAALEDAIGGVLYEVDFASLADNTFTDGTEVIDGRSWTCANSANLASFGIVNGSGIVATAAASTGTTMTSTTRTAGRIDINPSALVPTWDGARPLILELHVASATLTGNTADTIDVGIYGDTGSPATNSVARLRMAGITRVTALGGHGLRRMQDASNSAISIALTGTTDQVVGIKLSEGEQVPIYGVANYSSDWPQMGSAALMTSGSGVNSQIVHPGNRVFIAFCTASTGSPTMTATVRRLRVRTV